MSNPKHHKRSSHKQPHKPAHGYWLYGHHAVMAALANPRRIVRRIVMAAKDEKIETAAGSRRLEVDFMTMQELNQLLPLGAVHQGVAAEVAPLPERSLEEHMDKLQAKDAILLLLDQVTDPHNVGAILRSAAAFGASAVITPRDHAPQESAVLAKASSGGIEIVPCITVTNLSQCMEQLKKRGFWCVGLDGEAKQTIAQAKPPRPLALVLGAEGRGLRRLTAERCDMLVRLPILPAMESLNVSNAAAVALYALRNEA